MTPGSVPATERDSAPTSAAPQSPKPASVPVLDGSESARIVGLSAAQFMGDIGPLRREITFEPMPDDVPVEAPAEPEKVPA